MTRRHLLALSIAAFVVAIPAAVAVFIALGAYDVGADAPHFRLTSGLLEAVRNRSVAARASAIDVPQDFMTDRERLRRGAGNYQAMCEGCHLAPGVKPTELSLGLYPAPPNLSQDRGRDPAKVFWVIKHGIKASGMPAWGKSMSDTDIWDLAAFVQQLPAMTEEQYEQMVAQSEAHSHGGLKAPASGAARDRHGPADGGHSHGPEEAVSHAGRDGQPAPATGVPPQERPHGPPGHTH